MAGAPEGNQYALGNEGGRPTDYKEEFNDQVFKLCLLGATDKEMATFFEISEVTFNDWKKRHPEFSKSIIEGKIKADANVANSLYRRAVGFEYDEYSWEKLDKEGVSVSESGEIIKHDLYKKKVVTKLMPPDVAAANIWLKNRRGRRQVDADAGGQQWTDKQEHGFTDNDGKDLKALPVKFE